MGYLNVMFLELPSSLITGLKAPNLYFVRLYQYPPPSLKLHYSMRSSPLNNWYMKLFKGFIQLQSCIINSACLDIMQLCFTSLGTPCPVASLSLICGLLITV